MDTKMNYYHWFEFPKATLDATETVVKQVGLMLEVAKKVNCPRSMVVCAQLRDFCNVFINTAEAKIFDPDRRPRVRNIGFYEDTIKNTPELNNAEMSRVFSSIECNLKQMLETTYLTKEDAMKSHGLAVELEYEFSYIYSMIYAFPLLREDFSLWGIVLKYERNLLRERR